MYEDKELSLVPFEEKDANNATYRSWFLNPKITKYNSHGLFPLTEDRFNSFVKGLHKDHIVFKIIINIEKKWIGNCSIQSFNWINRSAELAIVIGDASVWGKGYAKRALMLLLKHGFDKLNLNRIWTGTSASNIGMQKVASAIGMHHEGTSRQGTYLHGTYFDIYHYGILRDEWYEKFK